SLPDSGMASRGRSRSHKACYSLGGVIFRDGGSGPCPRCSVPLTGEWSSGREHISCQRCSGRFVGFSTLQRSHAAIASLLGTSPTTLPAAALRCPRCHDEMRSLTLLAVMVDFCPRHGIWFDTEELERLTASAR